MSTRVAVIAAAGLVCAQLGCVGQIEGVANVDPDYTEVIVLQGANLTSELAASPVHKAKVPFVRVGAIWEADRPGAIEISVSADGQAWTPWMPVVVEHIELEHTIGSFVGQIELEQPMSYYRLRSPGGIAEYARIELLQTTLSESIEDGDGSSTSHAERSVDPTVNPRSSWGAAPSRCSASLGKPYRMAIHHTETPTSDSLSPEARLRSIQSYHQNTRGWCDIGYHYLMSRDGRLWQGRPDNLMGAHTGGSNTGNIGIAVMGSHDSTPITATQVDRLAALIRKLATANGIPINRDAIKGHRQYKSTSCPGDALYAQLDEIVDTAASTDQPPPTPPPAETVTVMGVLYAGSNTAERIEGATVTLGSRTTVTSSSGLWQFDDVPVGSYSVTASAEGYVSRTISRSTYADPSWASFGLAPDTSIDTGTAVLQGVIYSGSSSSNRIPYATVTLSTGDTVTADANGFYKLVDLPAGPVTITASADGFDSASVDRVLADGETEWGSVKLTATTAAGEVGGPGSTCELCVDYDYLCCNLPDNDMYYLTSYDGGEAMACGGYADGVSYYATSWVRWGCGAKLRVTNPDNGACVVVEVADAGPADWVEDYAGGPVLDASTQVCLDLFDSVSCGWSDGRVIRVVEVPATTPTGPSGCL